MRKYILSTKQLRAYLLQRYQLPMVNAIIAFFDLPPKCTFWEFITYMNEFLMSPVPELPIVGVVHPKDWPKMHLCFSVYASGGDPSHHIPARVSLLNMLSYLAEPCGPQGYDLTMDSDIILRSIHNKWAHHSEKVQKEREEQA